MEGVFVEGKKFNWGFHFEERCLLRSLSQLTVLLLILLNVKASQTLHQLHYVLMVLLLVLVLAYVIPLISQILVVLTNNVESKIANVRILVRLHASSLLIVHMQIAHVPVILLSIL